MLQSFSGPKCPNTCCFCFTRQSLTSPGAVHSSGPLLTGPHAGAAVARGHPRPTAAFSAGSGTAGAGKVEVGSGRGLWCCCTLCQGPWWPQRDLEGNVWFPWRGPCALVCPKMRLSSCAAETLKIPVTSALTNSNSPLLLSIKLAKYFLASWQMLLRNIMPQPTRHMSASRWLQWRNLEAREVTKVFGFVFQALLSAWCSHGRTWLWRLGCRASGSMLAKLGCRPCWCWPVQPVLLLRHMLVCLSRDGCSFFWRVWTGSWISVLSS